MTVNGDFLQQMAASSRERVAAAKRVRPEAQLLEQALASPLPPELHASPYGFDLIAELKLRSPAVGQLRSSDENVAVRVSEYAQAGAAAVSVLTEPSRFDGSMKHLETAARTLALHGVPAMRKDFLVDPYQVIEARVAGAGGVLMILRMLPRAQTEELLEAARALGLFVLLEGFDEQDVEEMHDVVGAGIDVAAGQAPRLLVGLNCRDLTTLQIVPERLVRLAHLLPTGFLRVAESGVTSPEDARRVAQAGYDLALVGSALMEGEDPRGLATQMLDAGRSAKV